MTELVYDKRLYKYIKMTAIPNENMAFVEYIKNSYGVFEFHLNHIPKVVIFIKFIKNFRIKKNTKLFSLVFQLV